MGDDYSIILARISALIYNFTREVTKLLWQRSVCLGSWMQPFLLAILSLTKWTRNEQGKTIVPSCSEKFSLGTPNFIAIWNAGTGGGGVHKTFWVILIKTSKKVLSCCSVSVRSVSGGGFSYYPACPQRCIQRCHYSILIRLSTKLWCPAGASYTRIPRMSQTRVFKQALLYGGKGLKCNHRLC